MGRALTNPYTEERPTITTIRLARRLPASIVLRPVMDRTTITNGKESHYQRTLVLRGDERIGSIDVPVCEHEFYAQLDELLSLFKEHIA